MVMGLGSPNVALKCEKQRRPEIHLSSASLLLLLFVFLVPDLFSQSTIVETLVKTVGSIGVGVDMTAIDAKFTQFWRDHLNHAAVTALFV